MLGVFSFEFAFGWLFSVFLVFLVSCALLALGLVFVEFEFLLIFRIGWPFGFSFLGSLGTVFY